MTITLRSATATGTTTKGSALTHAEMDANFTSLMDSSNQSFLQSGSGAQSRTVQAKLREVETSPLDYGSSVTATTIQAALDAVNTAGGGKVNIKTIGTHSISAQMTVGSNTTVEIGSGCVLQLAASVNTSMFTNKDTVGGNTNIHFLGDGVLDGNKTNQTAGTESRAIYLVSCSQSSVNDLLVKDTEDHGIFFSLDGTQIGNSVANIRVSGAGKNSSSVGGSGISITNAKDFVIDAPQVTGAFRAGLRWSGTNVVVNGGVIDTCGNGGIVPVSASVITINGTVCRDCTGDISADGIRLVGIDKVTINGAICTGNDGSGVMILNGCDYVTVNGGLFYNNGNSATARASTTGRDGITVKNSGTANSNISVVGAECFDDRGGSATQDYGLAVENSSAITYSGITATGNETQEIYLPTTGTIRSGGVNLGDTRSVFNTTAVTVTGTTSATDLMTATIKGNTIGAGRGFRGAAWGDAAGTANSKVIRFCVGSSLTVAVSLAAGSTADWSIQFEVLNAATNSQRVSFRAFEATSAVDSVQVYTTTEDTTSDLIVKCTATLVDGADSVVQRGFFIEAIR